MMFAKPDPCAGLMKGVAMASLRALDSVEIWIDFAGSDRETRWPR